MILWFKCSDGGALQGLLDELLIIIAILLELSIGLPEHLPQNSLCCVKRIVTGATLTMTNGKGFTRCSVAAQQEAAPNHVQVEHESVENFVRGQFSSLAAKMDSILAGQAAPEKRCEAIESRVDSNTQQLSDIIRSLNFESKRINEHDAELADLKQVVKELQNKSQQDTSIINSLAPEMNSLQRYTRSFNVRILGIPQEKDENCVESVERLFVEHFGVPNGSIENAHRVGKSDAGKPRQMIARFHSSATRHLCSHGRRQRDSCQHRAPRHRRPYTKRPGN